VNAGNRLFLLFGRCAVRNFSGCVRQEIDGEPAEKPPRFLAWKNGEWIDGTEAREKLALSMRKDKMR
jgi:hypothetical protein